MTQELIKKEVTKLGDVHITYRDDDGDTHITIQKGMTNKEGVYFGIDWTSKKTDNTQSLGSFIEDRDTLLEIQKILNIILGHTDIIYNIHDMIKTQQRRLESLPIDAKDIIMRKGVHDTNVTIHSLLHKLL